MSLSRRPASNSIARDLQPLRSLQTLSGQSANPVCYFKRCPLLRTLKLNLTTLVLAKISDLTGRPNTFVLSLTFYTMGFIIVAASATLSAWVIGTVWIAIGFSGLQFLASVLIADLTSLQWRGMAQGLVASPYIINVW